MIPLSDDASPRSFPIITVGIILANVLVFLYELSLGDGVQRFVEAAGVVSTEYAFRWDVRRRADGQAERGPGAQNGGLEADQGGSHP